MIYWCVFHLFFFSLCFFFSFFFSSNPKLKNLKKIFTGCKIHSLLIIQNIGDMYTPSHQDTHLYIDNDNWVVSERPKLPRQVKGGDSVHQLFDFDVLQVCYSKISDIIKSRKMLMIIFFRLACQKTKYWSATSIGNNPRLSSMCESCNSRILSNREDKISIDFELSC